jgi:2,5-dichlorohydroquinone reductive dechlorinase
MRDADIEALVRDVNRRYTDPERNSVIGGSPDEAPRFELYHFHLSLCSYKLRTVLDEKRAAYVSHDIDIFPPDIQNYYPEYVRLRLKGGAMEGLLGRFVSDYTGRSSTESEGFDPCVVPTLVDHENGRVLVNSKRMCMYLEAEVEGGTQLVPPDLAADVVRQVDIVDRTPHVAVLYGAHPGNDPRPAFVRRDMPGVHDLKIGKLRDNMALAGADPLVIAAYESKIAKEAAAKRFVRTEQDMRGALEEFRDIVAQLDRDLAATGQTWLFGSRFTLADVFWAVSLFRMSWLGLGYLFHGTAVGQARPRVAAYHRALMARPSFRRAVIDWPRHPPSEHLPEYYARTPESARPALI